MPESVVSAGIVAVLPAPGKYHAVATVFASGGSASIDLRSHDTIVAMFAPFESVSLVSAVASVTAPAAKEPVTIDLGWVANSAPNSQATARGAFYGVNTWTSNYSGTHLQCPLEVGHHFGTELKSLVTGNPAPKAVVHTADQCLLTVRITFDATGFAAV